MHVAAYKQMRRMIAAHVMPRFTGGRVLDVGCRKTDPADLDHRSLFSGPHWTVTGLDDRSGPNVDIIADCLAWRTGDRFPVIVCGQMLEHCRAPWKAVAAMADNLIPGGVLLLVAPFMWHLHGHPDDYWRFTGEGLAELCRQAGLVVIESGERKHSRKYHRDAYCAAEKEAA